MEKESVFRLETPLRVQENAATLLSDLRFQLCGTTYPNRNYRISRPASRIGCIEYIVKGTGTVTIGGNTFSPVAGDTYFLPPGTDQLYYSDKSDPWEKIWVNVAGDSVNALAELFGVGKVFHYPGLDTSDLLLKFQYYAARDDIEGKYEKYTSLFSALLCRMAQRLYVPAETDDSPVTRMLRYIERHETDAIRLEDLAAAAGRSPSQAERLFRAETGVSPCRYAMKKKIDAAKRLLTETDLTVKAIAKFCAFDDEFYFSGVFRRHTGLSPSQYRKSKKDSG